AGAVAGAGAGTVQPRPDGGPAGGHRGAAVRRGGRRHGRGPAPPRRRIDRPGGGQPVQPAAGRHPRDRLHRPHRDERQERRPPTRRRNHHALTLLLLVLALGRWASLVPMCALASVLAVVAYHMSEWHTFRALLRAPRGDVAVLLTTFTLTVAFDLTV